MSILSATGKIIMVQEPVSGRFGLQKLLAKLSSNAYGVNWNGSDEISLVTFNKKRTICKILHVDDTGVDCTTRILNHGNFKVLLDEGLIPRRLTREALERLIIDGTLEGEYQNEIRGSGKKCIRYSKWKVSGRTKKTSDSYVEKNGI